MPNSRSSYMAKKAAVDDGGSVTFTPPFGCNIWQLRFMTPNTAGAFISVSTIDEDGDAIEIDGSPFDVDAGDFDTLGDLEITIDSSNPSVIVEPDGFEPEWVKCKAYRSLDDVTSGGTYSTTLGVS